MRVLIVGAGAVGSVLGGFLAKAGHDVALLGRAWHLDVVQQQGLTVTGLWGTHRIAPLTLATDPDDLPQGKPFDWLFLCVKAHQTASALEVLERFLNGQTLVCAFQNGLGNYEAITQRIPPARVVLGRVIFGAELEPGRVQVTVCADDVLVGAPDPCVPQEAMMRLAAALRESGIPARTTPTILSALWGKALYNCALNGLSTLLEVPYGRLLEVPVARQLMLSVVEEGYQVASARHVLLDPPTAPGYWELLTHRLIPQTAAHHSSMLQDLRRGKPTEIEALNGAIVRFGQQAGVLTPANAVITRLVHTKERFVRSEASGQRSEAGAEGPHSKCLGGAEI